MRPYWWSVLLPHLARGGAGVCGVAGARRVPTSSELRWRTMHPGAQQCGGPGSLVQCCGRYGGDVGLLLRSLDEKWLGCARLLDWTGRPAGQST
ncbi:hypothetical protein NDU88_004299 [Pleurodeles waltl]|uniref:Secreted protein n=1 Tax=Pleurodeles waltl TaxID=8319 RepID=A0AAV7RJX5_PLEWA|nr:hypothetical protein NDU88_004299 [Pleurodeles waltl]